MRIPPGRTEAEVLAAIEKSVSILAPSFVFGYYDLEDVKQHGRLAAVKILEKGGYDAARPLENWLYTGIRNAYINLRRDKLHRNDPPCRHCASGQPCGAGGELCEKYICWCERNRSKSNLMCPLDINHISDEREKRARTPSTISDDVEISELLQRIDEQLPVELRSYYLQMRAGVNIPKTRRLQVEEAVKEILKGDIECPESDE